MKALLINIEQSFEATKELRRNKLFFSRNSYKSDNTWNFLSKNRYKLNEDDQIRC